MIDSHEFLSANSGLVRQKSNANVYNLIFVRLRSPAELVSVFCCVDSVTAVKEKEKANFCSTIWHSINNLDAKSCKYFRFRRASVSSITLAECPSPININSIKISIATRKKNHSAAIAWRIDCAVQPARLTSRIQVPRHPKWPIHSRISFCCHFACLVDSTIGSNFVFSERFLSVLPRFAQEIAFNGTLGTKQQQRWTLGRHWREATWFEMQSHLSASLTVSSSLHSALRSGDTEPNSWILNDSDENCWRL